MKVYCLFLKDGHNYSDNQITIELEEIYLKKEDAIAAKEAYTRINKHYGLEYFVQEREVL